MKISPYEIMQEVSCCWENTVGTWEGVGQRSLEEQWCVRINYLMLKCIINKSQGPFFSIISTSLDKYMYVDLSRTLNAGVLLKYFYIVAQGTTPSVRSLHFLFGWKSALSVFEISFFWPVSMHFVSPLISDSHFTFDFWGPLAFCLSIILIESVSGCGFYSLHHLLNTEGPVCFASETSPSSADVKMWI